MSLTFNLQFTSNKLFCNLTISVGLSTTQPKFLEGHTPTVSRSIQLYHSVTTDIVNSTCNVKKNK